MELYKDISETPLWDNYGFSAQIRSLDINLKLAHPDAKVPTKAHGDEDSCFDLYSCENVLLPYEGMKLVDTGVIMQIPFGWGGWIWDRSGLAVKGITTRAGVIDSNYRGTIKVVMVNEGDDERATRISVGDRIAQIDFRRIYAVSFNVVDEITETSRKGGFGSSGT